MKWISGEYFFKVCLFFFIVNVGFDLLTQGYVSHTTLVFIPIGIIVWCLFKSIVNTYFSDIDEVYQEKKWNDKRYRDVKIATFISAVILVSMLLLGYQHTTLYYVIFALLVIGDLVTIVMAYKDARNDSQHD